jgi:urea transport system ATP-binding protein
MNTIDLIEDERPEGSDGADQMGHLVTGELDLSHGVALYLEDITVSFDGFRALNKLNLKSTPASCAASSAPTAPARRP